MLLTNTNINTLPFYKTKEEQWHRREGCEYHPIFVPTTNITPFQLATPHRAVSSVTELKYNVLLYDYSDIYIKNIDSICDTGYVNESGYSIFTNKGAEVPGLLESGKLYYIKIQVYNDLNGILDTFYSDLFEAGNGIDNIIKLTYWNEKNIDYGDYKIVSHMYLQDYTFPFISYFNSEIGRPGYEFINDISERNGLEYPLVLRSNKTFTFPITVNEPQMDALRLAAISDQIAIEQGDNLYKVFWLEFSEIEWEQNGIGTVYITFKVNAMINKTSPAASNRGDFNNDFNEDFL